MAVEALNRKLVKLETKLRDSSAQSLLDSMEWQELVDLALVLESLIARRRDDSSPDGDIEVSKKKAVQSFLEGYRQVGRDAYLRAVLLAEYDCPHCGTRLEVDVDAAIESGRYPGCRCSDRGTCNSVENEFVAVS